MSCKPDSNPELEHAVLRVLSERDRKLRNFLHGLFWGVMLSAAVSILVAFITLIN